MNFNKQPIRVYADTTVFGGIADAEFAAVSRIFFNAVRAGMFSLVTSSLVQQEIAFAPEAVQELFTELLAIADVATITEEALRLRRAYTEAGFVRAKSLNDALHVATATISGCALIVSWNFRDIVNFRKIPLYSAINTLNGYGSIAIHSPLEIITDEEQNI